MIPLVVSGPAETLSRKICSKVCESSGGGGEDEELARSPSDEVMLQFHSPPAKPPSRTCSKRARYAYVAVVVVAVVVVVVWVSVFAGVPQPSGPGPGNSTNRTDSPEQDVTCPRPLADREIVIKHQRVKAGPILETLTFSCSPPKRLNGTSELTCNETGQWDHVFPSCEVSCEVPQLQANLHIRNQPQTSLLWKGNELQFRCSGRLYLQGSEHIECLADGSWSDKVPICSESNSCGAPPYLQDGDIRGTPRSEYNYGDRVEYICQTSYIIKGGSRTCQNGQWVGDVKCLIKPCGQPGDADYADFHLVTGEDFVFGSEVEYTCQTGYQMVRGSSKRQCTLNGWDGADPVCQYCSSNLGIQYQQRPWLNDQLTASSEFTRWNYTYHSYYARLGNGGYWSPDTNNQHQWLQVDLKRRKTITGIITQGGRSYSTSYYVKSFKVSHSDDGQSWTAIRDAKRSEIFTVDIVGISGSSQRRNPFESPITSQFVRVVPWTWYNGIALRIELKGCDD